jgi:putative DNA primase/helicase
MWQSNGVSIVPIVAKNQPAVRWKQYQARIPDLGEINDWWGNGHPWGIALICGAVSGNLEMTEIEGRALSAAGLTKVANSADTLGCGELWDRLSTGFTQASPSGGLHLVYRISDHEVPGNEKIAHAEPSLDEKSGRMVQLVLAETRGEGGYFVGAPSPGSCHPSGEGWLLASGVYGEVPTITWDERQQLHEAIRQALDIPRPSVSPPFDESTRDQLTQALSDVPDLHNPSSISPHSATLHEAALQATASPGVLDRRAASISPGDHWSASTDWADILEPEGWTLLRGQHNVSLGERLWVRPGKNAREGHSASTDYQGKPGLYVWSTSAGLESETPLSKLFVLAHYQFHGDMKLAAQDLKRRGFGTVAQPDLTLGELDLNSTNEEPAPDPHFSHDDTGNAMRLWHTVGRARFRWVYEQKEVYAWTGKEWAPDYKGALDREWIKLTESMEREGLDQENAALIKWARRSRSRDRHNAALSMMRVMEGATISASEMNTAPDHLNLYNGTYNMKTGVLEPHNPEHLMTRTMVASYNPEATCPKFEQFMEQVLPDPEVRAYVQRAVGYSLLGKADHRAFFLIHGPSGTGKSQFLSTMEYVFGGYGATAAEGTFRVHEGSGPNNDLHGLRGKRFVSTSETAENATFNENLLKRLTGTDQVVSREMYQTNVTWRPECALWLATNHPPRFNSDDDAIWKRAKLVPFVTRFGTDVPEIPNFARDYLYAEADGIFNWVLAGLHDFLANGLQEPEGVLEAANKHRQQSDTVARFLDDQIADGNLQEVPEATIRTSELFAMYEQWGKSSGERGLGSRRFINRLESTGRATYTRTNAHSVWKGLHRSGVLGAYQTSVDET